jgi:hypothetical protein
LIAFQPRDGIDKFEWSRRIYAPTSAYAAMVEDDGEDEHHRFYAHL